MQICTKCGMEFENGANFCPHCGAAVSQPEQQGQPTAGFQPNEQQYYTGNQQSWPPYYQAPYGATQNTTGMLVWSILMLILCCLPFGIVALVYTVNAKSARTQEEFHHKMEVAKVWNIVSLVCGVISAILTAVSICAPSYYYF